MIIINYLVYFKQLFNINYLNNNNYIFYLKNVYL